MAFGISSTSRKSLLAQVKKIVDTARSTPGRNGKIALFSAALQQEGVGDTLRKVIEHTYNPFMMYKATHLIAWKDVATMPMTMRCGFKYHTASEEAVFWKLDEMAKQVGSSYDDIAELAFYCVSKDDYDLVTLILNKSLDCGLAHKTFCKLVPTLPKHQCMLCDKDFDRFTASLKSSERACCSIKLDGVRTWAIEDSFGQHYVSRKGNDYLNFRVFDEEVCRFIEQVKVCLKVRFPNQYEKMVVQEDGGRFILDGEAISRSRNFERFVSNLKSSDGDPSEFNYYVFDTVIPDLILEDRLYLLSEAYEICEREKAFERVFLLQHFPIPHLSFEEVKRLRDEAIAAGEEGVVVKDLDSPYIFDRDVAWCKVKEMKEADLPVVGMFMGKKRLEKMMGGLIVRVFDTDVKVGSGFTDLERTDFLDPTKRPKVITVQYQEMTKKGSLRFPVYLRRRDDKGIEDCEYQTED